ncbi:carbon storage regulator CsrA [Pseudomonas cremoricolorata]|uniref:Translational regulator CsrA n=1 Tax=Pseudomonas cremoricolorata TaxID=157783 RepID=A0A089YJ60_9PSED|nr:carbon storage regulator CsrA [Pseudomonas cremoricolorata]AIR91698.1 carbon storage regulator [Pseudomonas cremoricolorata]
MLVFVREVGESIVIGDDITIKLVDLRRGVVRMGVEAPRHVEVHRSEVFKRIRAQRKCEQSDGSGPERSRR